ncbi:uncharacterized protein LOC126687536 [Mercurialis annua]|uniref:uncharacterized protein LOC126687536 n=1 Tax=Mercurialis annua TaxID=3986 RepID=UPI002160B1F6|nr:uncharacterized protein LOC126687536 [Mercurialis annua]
MLSGNLINFFLDDSDDDLEITVSTLRESINRNRRASLYRMSVYGRSYIWRNRVHCHYKIYHDYFGENLVYSPSLLRRRFRMSRSLFLHIQSAIESYDPYFIQKRDVAADYVDEYVRIGESCHDPNY